jgi:large subunit ribosomal protein L30
MANANSSKTAVKTVAKTGKSGAQVKVTLIKSLAGQLRAHQATARGLGLRHIRDSAVLSVTPQIEGMLRASQHLLKVEQL